MLVEHTFVTTMDMDEALRLAGGFLAGLGFRVQAARGGSLEAVRGRAEPNSRKLAMLPQTVKLVFDRGRVTVAAGILPRAGKELPVHANLMIALARGLEALLVSRMQPDRAAAEWHVIGTSMPKIWTTGDRVALGCLVALGGMVVLGILVGILAAVLRH